MATSNRIPWLVVLALASTTIAGAFVRSESPSAVAQVGEGIGFNCRSADGATVAWAARSGDGTQEYWAYIQGEFEFASRRHTAANPWALGGIYDSAVPTDSFEAFRTEVLSRSAAQGKTIIFHNMTVAETITHN